MGTAVKNALQAFASGVLFCAAVTVLLMQTGRLMKLEKALPQEQTVSEASFESKPDSIRFAYSQVVAMIADEKRNYDVYVENVLFPAGGYTPGLLLPELLPEAQFYSMSCKYDDKGHVKDVHFERL